MITLVVMATGASRLDRSMLTRPAPGNAAATEASLSGSSLYQLDSEWTNDRGERVRLKDLGGSTQIMAMVFTRCPSLCPTLVHDLKAMQASMDAGTRSGTRFVLVTIDPEHDTPAALREFRAHMGLDAAHWTLLRGSDAATRELAAVLGFAYGKGDGRNYTHSSLVTVLDKGGVIVHQQTGLGSDPTRALMAIENSRTR
jgi:protein SCO1/2